MSITERLKGVQVITSDLLSETPPPPKSVKIEIVPYCNYNCMYCSLVFRDEQPTDCMSYPLFKNIVNQMKEAGVEEVGPFLIGEPFMNFPQLSRAVKYLKKVGIPYVFITSNGSLAGYSYVKGIMDKGLDSLKWSVNACDSEQFCQYMGASKEMFERMKFNIKQAFEIRSKGGYKTKLYASSILYTPEQREKAKPFLEEFILPYVDEHYWLPLYTMGGVAKDTENENGLQPIAGNTGRVDDPVEPIPCWPRFTAGHILVNGKMTACCTDGTGNWEVGDLNHMSFMEAWHSEEFKKLRRAHMEKNIIGTKCAKCALAG